MLEFAALAPGGAGADLLAEQPGVARAGARRACTSDESPYAPLLDAVVAPLPGA